MNRYQAVQLEYKSMRSVPPTVQGSQFISTVVLPKNNGDMETLIREFSENPELLLSSFPQREGTLMLPRFKIEFGAELKNSLEKLGLLLQIFLPKCRNASGIHSRCTISKLN